MGLFTIAGVLEGFYGRPWSWADRRTVMEHAVAAGLPWYAWAPKSDPLHRDAWSVPFSDEHLAGFADLLTVEGLHLCIGISPGGRPQGPADEADLSVEDTVALIAGKLDPVLQLVEAVGSHTPIVMVAFDDLPPDLNDPIRHGEIVAALSEQLDHRALLAVVPAHYAGTVRTEYLEAFSESLPPDVMIGWTGPMVVNEHIDAVAAEAFSDAVDGRPLLLWDNYPVNDAVMKDQLNLLPLRGRDSLLSEFCPAYFANAAVQPHLSLPGLLSAAAFCETGAAAEAWDEFEQPVQVALLAEACDGRELLRLTELCLADPESSAFDDLWWWMERIEALELDGAMGDEARPWVEAANREAELCLIALDLLEREADDEDIPGLVLDIWRRWPSARRSTVNVLGHRLAIRPTLTIDASGSWQLAAPSAMTNRNVTDRLCEAALLRKSGSTAY
jgi:hyaluronoglucosaminidase